MSDAQQPIGTRTARSMVWAYSSYIGGRLLVLVSMAILARLLSPQDFGLLALALIVTTAFETLKDIGLGQALVAAPEDRVLQVADTVFFATVALGAALWALIAALGPIAAAIFDEPRIAQIMPVLGSVFLIRALGITHYSLAQRRLDFRARTIAETSDVVVRGLTGIGLALAGFGVWSLVLGYVVGAAVLTVAVWLLVPWRPRPRFDRAALSPLLRFGGALTGVEVSDSIYRNVDPVFIGKALGASALGLYTIAYRLPELVIQNLAVVAGAVLFPAFAVVERPVLRRAYLVAFRYTVMVTLPIAVAFVLLAEPMLGAVFGDQWIGAAGAMQALAVYAFLVTVDIPAGTVYKAVGRADVLLKLAVPRLLVAIGAVAIVVDEGIVAVALAQAAVGVAFTVVALGLASRLLEVRLRELGAAAWPSLVATAAVAAVLVGVEQLVAGAWPTLICAAAAGAGAYLAALALIAPAFLRELLARLLPSGSAKAPLPSAPGGDSR